MRDIVVMDIMPLAGVGPIRLGATRAESRAAMTQAGLLLGSSRDDSDYYVGSSIQVEHGPDGRAWFIGVSHSREFRAVYRGQDVFRMSAHALFELAARADHSGPHAYTADEYCFPNQILTLWAADEQYDYDGRGRMPVWAQVGVGNAQYAAAVAALSLDG